MDKIFELWWSLGEWFCGKFVGHAYRTRYDKLSQRTFKCIHCGRIIRLLSQEEMVESNAQ